MTFEEPTLEEPTITMPNLGATTFEGTCTEANTDVYVSLDRDGDYLIEDELAISDGQSWIMVMPDEEVIENGDVIEAYHLKTNGEYSEEATLTVTGGGINLPLLGWGPIVDDPELAIQSSYTGDPENDVQVYVKVNGGEQIELEYLPDDNVFYCAFETNFVYGDTVEYWQVVNGTSSQHATANAQYYSPQFEQSENTITLQSYYATDENTAIGCCKVNGGETLSAPFTRSGDNWIATITTVLQPNDTIAYWQTIDGVESMVGIYTVPPAPQ